jgi:branched-chain amino acid transport system ATP-binding protein
MSLLVNHVAAKIGDVPILYDVHFGVESHEVLALVGRNGMGKTTTLKTLMGLATVTGGSIMSDGQELTKLKIHQRRRSGLVYVPEDGGVFQTLTVEENLALVCDRPHREALGPFPELMPLWHKKAALLSGGERKMLAFGRAWLSNAKWFLIDEPSLGLAPMVVKRSTSGVLPRRG